jgi:hypothetical protein
MILEEYSGTKWPVKSGPNAVKILQVAKTKKKYKKNPPFHFGCITDPS